MFFGHGCVGLTTSRGVRLVVDPYAPENLGGRLGRRRLGVEADFVAVTHDHADHSAVDEVAGATVVRGEGAFGPFEVSRHTYAHDEYGGARFGGEVDILAVEVGGVRVVHASDVGQSPDGRLADDLKTPDLAVVPVGGHYTAGAAQAREWTVRMAPRAVVPAHYATETTQLPLQSRRPFRAFFDDATAGVGSRIVLPRALPERGTRLMALEPAR